MEKRIVGKWAFNVVVGILLTGMTFLCGLNVFFFNSIKGDIDSIQKQMTSITVELAKHTATGK